MLFVLWAILWVLPSKSLAQTESPTPADGCPELPKDPFYYVKESEDLSDVLYICTFQADFNYSCRYTQRGLEGYLASQQNPDGQLAPDPSGNDAATFLVPETTESRDLPPIADIKIEFLSSTAAKVTVHCSSDDKDSSQTTESQDPQFPLSPAEKRNQWETKKLGIIKSEKLLDVSGPEIARCYFKSARYECFGVPTCSEGCDKPCSGGEPWRGFYNGNPSAGFSGNITDEAMSSGGMGNPAGKGMMQDDTGVHPLLFLCPSEILKEKCASWKAYYIFKEQFKKRDNSLCTRLAYLMRQASE